MGKLLNVFTSLHKSTKRDYIGRMMDEKVQCMKKAREFEFDFWDGDRRYGYGGYKYDGRWKTVAENLISVYGLTPNAKILDVGCGKAHLLYELKQLLPEADICGFDVSLHGISNAPVEIRNMLFKYRAQDVLPFGDQQFDLVLSLNCLHNLKIYELKTALTEIERVGKNKFVVVESYRNEIELFNLQCWALTAECFYDTAEWIWIFKCYGYHGDYEFIYFE